MKLRFKKQGTKRINPHQSFIFDIKIRDPLGESVILDVHNSRKKELVETLGLIIKKLR